MVKILYNSATERTTQTIVRYKKNLFYICHLWWQLEHSNMVVIPSSADLFWTSTDMVFLLLHTRQASAPSSTQTLPFCFSLSRKIVLLISLNFSCGLIPLIVIHSILNLYHCSMAVLLPSGWEGFMVSMADELDEIVLVLQREINKGTVIFPAMPNILKAFYETQLSSVRVVMLGQEPYKGAGKANGLSFSVNKGHPTPPSLANIFKEISTEIEELFVPSHGDLTKWCKQGVLLLNAALTTENASSRSHDAL